MGIEFPPASIQPASLFFPLLFVYYCVIIFYVVCVGWQRFIKLKEPFKH